MEPRLRFIQSGTTPMIHCVPRGICSWNFLLEGGGHSGSTEINTWSEQGTLTADGQHFQVAKGGWLSGEWTLQDGSGVIARARKISAFTRTFEISSPGGPLTLKAVSAFGRTMTLTGPGAECTFAPDHAFTRRSTIQGNLGDFRMVTFAFWLATLLWRRAANNNNGAGGGS